MKEKLIGNIEELEEWIQQNDTIYLFGAGKVCEQIIKKISQAGKFFCIAAIYVSKKENKKNQINGIKIEEFGKTHFDKNAVILKAVSKRYSKEITDYLTQSGVKHIVGFTADFEEKLNENLIQELRKKILNISKKSDEKKKIKDILFLSPPFWDIYSPFSAVPCLVGKLKEAGFIADQKDIGIYCMQYLIKKDWKDTVAYFLTEQFYEEEVKLYKENTYSSWEDYKNAIWFLQGNSFDLQLMKKNYLKFDAVQKRVLDAFYNEIYNRAVYYMDFDRCENIENICRYEMPKLYEMLSDDTVNFIFENIPDIVGISITSTCQFVPGCILADLIKQCHPNVKVIVGGSCADLFVQSSYSHKEEIKKYFDYIIIGEGETAITKLMYYLKKGGSLEEIPNLVFIDESGDLHYTEQIVEEVTTLPIPDYDGLDLSLYLAPEVVLPYQTSRGCHYGQCAFCNHDQKYRHHYRSKDMKIVVKELLYLSQKYDTKCIQFVDEAIRPDCFKTMVDEMAQYDEFKEIKWFCYSRVSRRYEKEILQKAKENGCQMVMFGVESLNQRLLQFIKKGIHAETSKYCLRVFHDSGIKTYAWLMCNLPSETVEEARQDLEEIKQLGSCIDALSVGTFCLYSNTDMYLQPEKYNITAIDKENASRFTSHNNGVEIDKEEMMNFYLNEYVKYQKERCFFGNRYTVFFEN